MSSYKVAESADVDSSASIGDSSTIWDLVQVRENAQIGTECVLGRGAYVGSGVRVGNRVKIQNFSLIYEPAIIEDGVFIGPAVVFTNDLRPRAVNPDGTLKSAADWEPVGVQVLQGASIGARAVCVAPLTIGRWAMVAAGSTVTQDVPDFSLVAGTPARHVGWVGRSGERLERDGEHHWRCPVSGDTYVESGGTLILAATDEEPMS